MGLNKNFHHIVSANYDFKIFKVEDKRNHPFSITWKVKTSAPLDLFKNCMSCNKKFDKLPKMMYCHLYHFVLCDECDRLDWSCPIGKNDHVHYNISKLEVLK